MTSSVAAADGSMLVTVVASLPRGSSTAAEEMQYMTTVLQNDAKQVRCASHVATASQPSCLLCFPSNVVGCLPIKTLHAMLAL